MKSISSSALLLLLAFTAGLLPLSTTVRAQDANSLPPNLGRGLRPLVQWHRGQPAGRTVEESRDALVAHIGRKPVPAQVDADGNVTVDIRLNGTVAADEVKKSVAALGLTIIGEHAARHADQRDGMLSARLPLDKAVEAAKLPGIQSVLVAHRPRHCAGRVPGQGLDALNATSADVAPYTGNGLTVGVLSDSYDRTSPHAAADVQSGDLPSNVVVLNEGSRDDDDYNDDEGRAMLQIVHDVAPAAKLVFSTTGDTQTTFAAAIRQLRADPRSLCDVLVDDIGFSDEPFFSDSVVSEAVDDVVTSTTLGGKPVIYYSAAGNDGSASYTATFTPVSDADARAGNAGNNNLKLEQVPAALTAGGFQNFKGADTGHGMKIVQKLKVTDDDAEIDFQWDDPFDANRITADYNILVFDANGNYLPGDPKAGIDDAESGIDNNFSTGEAIEYAELPLNSDGSDTTYQIAITRASTRGSAPAARLRYFAYTNGSISGKYLDTGKPTLFGHSAARNADGVAAFDVHTPTIPEDFDSFGPVTILFDENGNRLATPEVRQQPTIAAVDGVNTTFFPQPVSENDSDGDGLPNFYGTSAAAPHAAAVAALLLEAAGGQRSLSATQMRALLESTAQDHDIDPAYSVANLASADGQYTLTLSAAGDASNNSAFSQKFFTLTYNGPAGSSLRKAIVDLSNASEVFDATVDLGYPFTIGEATGVPKADVTAALSAGASGYANSRLSLAFTAGAFVPGALLAFGLDRDDQVTMRGGNSADLLATAAVKARIIAADGSKVKLTGTFVNQTGHGYSPDVGYGLINAEAALKKLLGR